MLLPALALGLLAVVFAVPALRPRGPVSFQLAEHRVETAVLAVSLLVAWALVAML
jgi:hypothetical protein